MIIKKYENFLRERYRHQKLNFNEESLNEEIGIKDLTTIIALAIASLAAGEKVNAQSLKKIKSDLESSQETLQTYISDENEIEVVKDELKEMFPNKSDEEIEEIAIKRAKDLEGEISQILTDAPKRNSVLREFKKKRGGKRLLTGSSDNFYRIKELIEKGWAIGGVELDTIVNVIENDPTLRDDNNKGSDFKFEIEANYTEMLVDSDEYFNSGEFVPNTKFESDIKSFLNEIIKDDGLVLKIEIESSTDKQRIGEQTSKRLSENGYESTNKGLSLARNNSAKKVIENFFSGIGTNVIPKIDQIILWEQGEGIINDDARYVKVIVKWTKKIPDYFPTPSDTTSYGEIEKVPEGDTIQLIITKLELIKLVKEFTPKSPPDRGSTTKYRKRPKKKMKLHCPSFSFYKEIIKYYTDKVSKNIEIIIKNA